jgi:hypothetical protein
MYNGLYPSLVTEMFHSSKSLKQLTKVLAIIFSHGVKTDQVVISIVLAKQLQFHKLYIRALVDSMEVLLRPLARLDIGHLVTLFSDVYKMVGSARESLTPMLVDTLDKWVFATVNRKKEIMLSVGAKNMLGYLVCRENDFYFPVSDNSTIGSDSSCSFMLPVREVSRLQPRVFFSGGEVIIETVGKITMLGS